MRLAKGVSIRDDVKKGMMSKSIRRNLLAATAPLLLAELLMCYPIFVNDFPLWQFLVPTSLLTLVAAGFLRAARENPSYEAYGYFLGVIIFDTAYLCMMSY